MGDIALRVEGLGKQYHIVSGRREAYTTLRDTLTDVIVSSLRRAGKLLGGRGVRAADHSETIWALKNISFEIKRGEVIGIIGRMGRVQVNPPQGAEPNHRAVLGPRRDPRGGVGKLAWRSAPGSINGAGPAGRTFTSTAASSE